MPFNSNQASIRTGDTSGLGATGSWRSGAASALMPPSQGAQPTVEPRGAIPGVDPAWSRMFGSATPTSLLEQRTANGGVSPPPANAQISATSNYTPQTAGMANALVPGAINGNAENGWSSTQQNGGQSNNERGTTKPFRPQQPPVDNRQQMANALMPPPPAGQPPVAPPNMTPEQAAAWAAAHPANGSPPPVAPPPAKGVGPAVEPMQPPGGPLGAALQPMPKPPAPTPAPAPTTPPTPTPGVQQPQAVAPPGTPMVDAHGQPVAMAAGETQGGANEPLVAGQEKAGSGAEKPIGDGVTLTGDGTLGSGYALFGLAGHMPTTGNDLPVPSGTSTATQVGNWTAAPPGTVLPLTQDGAYNDTGYVHGGKLHPWSEMSWINPKTGQLRGSLDPIAFIDSDPARALTTSHFWDGAMGVDPKNVRNYPLLPDPASNQTPVTFRTTNFSDISKDASWSTLKPGVQSLVGYVTLLKKDLDALQQNPGTAGNAANVKAIQNKTTALRVGLDALDKYGVHFGAAVTPPPTGTPPATNPDGTPVTPPPVTTPGGQVGDPPADISNTTPGEGSGGNPADKFVNTNLDASDVPIKDAGGQYNSYHNQAVKIMGPNASDAEVDRATEFLIALKMQQDANNDKQSGLNLIGGADIAAQEDPNRSASQKMMSDVLANPDPTDWNTVRNKTVAASDAQGAQLSKDLAASAGRRGLSTGGVSTLDANMRAGMANSLNSRLGDLDVAQSVAKRQGQLQAMNAENSQYQLFNVGDVNMARDAAGYLVNPAQPGQSPAAGFLNSGLGIQAGNVAANAADTAKQNGMISAAGTFAGLLASIFLTPAAGAAVAAGTQAAVKANTPTNTGG